MADTAVDETLGHRANYELHPLVEVGWWITSAT